MGARRREIRAPIGSEDCTVEKELSLAMEHMLLDRVNDVLRERFPSNKWEKSFVVRGELMRLPDTSTCTDDCRDKALQGIPMSS